MYCVANKQNYEKFTRLVDHIIWEACLRARIGWLSEREIGYQKNLNGAILSLKKHQKQNLKK